MSTKDQALVAKVNLIRLIDSGVIGVGVMHYDSGWKLEVRTAKPFDPPLPTLTFDGVEVNVVPVGRVEAQ